MQIKLNCLFPLSGPPSHHVPVGVPLSYTGLSPGVPQPSPPTFPSRHSSDRPTSTALGPSGWCRRIFLLFYSTSSRDAERRACAGTQTDSRAHECAIRCLLHCVSLHCKVVFSVLEHVGVFLFVSSPLLRGIRLAKRLEHCLFFFFFFCTMVIDR